MNRKPAVAGYFYPSQSEELRSTISGMVDLEGDKKKAIGVISPHAGYVYSGPVAGALFSSVELPNRYILLGPSHRSISSRFALMSQGSWETPLGEIPVDAELAAQIAPLSDLIEEDEDAHRQEHSLEVQLPFIQHRRPDVEFVPIVLGWAGYPTCEEIGIDIARAIRRYGDPVVLIASTDMTHYESQESAKRKDQLAIDKVLAMDPAALLDTVATNNISMCGVIPTVITLVAAQELGATNASLVDYATSGDVSGDYSYVVGYAGFLIQ